MKRRIYFPFLMAILVIGIVPGCTKDEQITEEQPTVTDAEEPVFVVSETSVEGISYEGTSVMLEYYVTNPVEGAYLTFDNSGVADWTGSISDLSGIIEIEVLPNTDEESRTGELVVEYVYTWDSVEKSQTCTITLTQDAAPEVISFELGVDEVTHETAVVTVVPGNDEITYIVMAVSKEVYEIYIGSEDELYTTIIEQYTSAATSEGLTLAEYFEQYDIIKTGETATTLSGLSAETAYYAYAVGMSESGEQLSDFVFTEFTTDEMPLVEAGFTFGEVVTTDGWYTTVTITPSDDELYYYADFMAVNVFEETIMDWASYAQEIITGSVNTYVNYGGYTVEGAVKAICYQGPVEIEGYFLTAGADYYVYAFVVDLDGTVISDVYTTVFTVPSE